MFFKKIKIAKQNRKEAIQIMKDFVEGRINTEIFWEVFKNNTLLKEILIKDKTRPGWSFSMYYVPERIMDVYNGNKLEDRVELYDLVKRYMIRNKIECNFYNEDDNNWTFLMNIQPKWLCIRDEEFLLEIVNSAPSNLTEEEIAQWCKSRILELFKYDKEPPEWLQNPEWPIVEGKPLVFREIIEKRMGDAIIEEYIFYNDETKEEIIITQWDYE